jgi:hypothetical protein
LCIELVPFADRNGFWAIGSCGSGSAVAAVPLNDAVRKSVGRDGIGSAPLADASCAGTRTASEAVTARAARRTRFMDCI